VDGRDKPGHDGLGSKCHTIRFIQGDRGPVGTRNDG
jgi:hypothetical protein